MRLAALLAGTALSSAALAAPVLPTGGVVAVGTATIGTPTSGALTVTQTSGKAIIDWTGFSIGQAGKVQFDNGAGATLNRVTGTGVSAIDGLLGATGSVYLINPSGVIIGKTGVVKTGGSFVASTLDVADAAFLAGGPLRFAGSSTASVVNLGQVGSLGGDVALIATTVSNAGALSAPQGSAALVSGSAVVMTDGALDGGRFAVALPAKGGVTNTGAIAAAVAELRANGGDVYALAGDTTGVIRATGVAAGGGRVFLIAEGGTLTADGVVEARAADGSGGAIETSGATVRLDGARIATGAGGSWLIDPVDLTIDAAAATAIANGLATAAVTVQTTASGASGPGTQAPGAGDITVAAPITWSSGNGLTLSAYRNVDVNANLADSQSAKVVLAADNSATGVGTVAFAAGATASIQNGEVDIFYNPVSYTDAATRSTQAFTGSNTPDSTANPYTSFVTGGATTVASMLVNSLAQLQAINTELDGVYALNRDIDASSTATTPFAILGDGSDAAHRFTGALDGRGHVIDRLTINATNAVTGLIGLMYEGASISNLGLTNVAITGNAGISNGSNVAGDAVGAVVGYAHGGTIDNVYSTGSVTGYSQVGGLVGVGNIPISNSHSDATVTGGGSSVGGLIGEADGALTNDYATGTVNSGSGTSGGLVGYLFGTVAGSHATGAVTDAGGFGAGVGGLIGSINDSNSGNVVTDSYATGAVTGGYQETGGLVGQICCRAVTISRVYATGAVTGAAGENYLGGLIGYAYNASVDNAYASGAVAATGRYVGGLVGDLESASVSNSYALGAATGTNTVGGLIGQLVGSATVTGVYATGLVTATGGAGSDVGGLVGAGQATASVTNAYWDEGTTGQTTAVGGATAVPQTAITGVGGSTGLDPYAASTYASFDLSPNGPWYLDGAALVSGSYQGGQMRPLLRSEYSTTIVNGHQLQLIQLDLAATYTLGADVSLAELTGASGVWNPATGFIPLGTSDGSVAFSGTFDGRGHTISGLISTDAAFLDAGLFSTGSASSRISDVTLSNVTIAGGGTPDNVTGALVGDMSGTISAVTVSGSVSGGGIVGGVVGALTGSGVIANSDASASATAQGSFATAGGLVGSNVGSITSSVASGAVAGDAYAGGLVGYNGGSVTLASASGAVTGAGSVGGLIGDNAASGSVNHVSASGDVASSGAATSNGTYVGGLIGFNDASLDTVSATGSVTGLNFVGGLVGLSDTAGTTISNATAAGDVSGSNDVGGLIGLSRSSLEAVSASGAVTGHSDLGGLIGGSDAAGGPAGGGPAVVTISNASASGTVTSTTPLTDGDSVGGLIGFMNGGALTASSASGAVTGHNNVGGLVGYSGYTISNSNPVYATVSGSQAAGAVTGAQAVGGLTGYVAGGSVADSYATGAVGGQSDVGGLLGYIAAGATVSGSVVGATYASGAVTGSGSAVGGFAGANFGAVTLVAYTPIAGGVDGGTPGGGAIEVGGLVGVNGGTLDQVNATGAVNGRNEVGGLVGENAAGGSIIAGNAFGAVTGAGYVGGLVGRNYAALDSVSASGAVSGGGGTGGLVGVGEAGSSITTAIATGAVDGVNGFGTGDDVGGLVGANFGTVSGAAVSGAVTGKDHTGGLVGYNSGAVTNGSASGAVIGEAYVGGLVGLNYAAVQSSSASGAAGGTDYVGGLVGWNASSGSARNSTASGAVTATTAYLGDPSAPPGFYDNAGSGGYAGGLAGVNQGVLDSDQTLAAASVSGGLVVGGLVGLNQGTLSYASAAAPVTGDRNVGGLVGWNDTAGTISKSYATGAVTGRAGHGDPMTHDDYVGGLIGVNFGAASDVYATGAVTGVQVVGGLVGTNMGSISNAYATGAVTATRGALGGIAGVQAGTLADVYFQPATTGQASGVGYAVTTDAPTPIGPGTQYDAAAQTTYQGFDFTNTWQAGVSTPPTLKARSS